MLKELIGYNDDQFSIVINILSRVRVYGRGFELDDSN
jgi:hypothetical protein